MVYELWLPDHKLLHLVELRGKKLNQNPAGEIKTFLIFKHLGEANPVHQADQSIIVERLLAHLDYLNDQTKDLLIEWTLEKGIPVTGANFFFQVYRTNVWKNFRNHHLVYELENYLDSILPNIVQLSAALQSFCVSKIELRYKMSECPQQHIFELFINF